MFRTLTKQVIRGSSSLINQRVVVQYGVRSLSTATNTTTIDTLIDTPVGKALPNPRITPPKVPKRRPGKVRSVEYPQYDSIPRIAPKGLYRITKIGFDFYLVDVREKTAFDEISIKGSVNHPLATIEESTSTMDKSKMVLCFTDTEPSWPTACEGALRLKNKGFKNVIVIEGGIKDLVDKGFVYYSDKDII
ncbi:hypothetical protein CYY_008879 [Polysphondylium violaceum]|uniref:Rhodanese domain-containing protein n=1 Tax=Polysphondylium violaceum TaxID=133409 RepID=A0A8J4V0X5_9MYCE|nr:hypothetical protein CYY_008879 [Polysphondylium violaceum]